MTATTETFQTFHRLLEDRARRFPSKNYIVSIDQSRSISFGELNRRCNRVAGFLKNRGVGGGDRVTLIGHNSLETLVIFFGVLKYGAIVNPVNVQESPSSIRALLDRVDPELVLYDHQAHAFSGEDRSNCIPFFEMDDPGAPDGSLFQRIEHVQQEFTDPVCDNNGIAEILFTSGTTEIPKGVVISRESLFLMAEEVVDKIDLNSDDRILEYRSYSWASAQLLAVLSSMLAGATLVLARKFSRSNFTSWLKDYQVTIAAGVPTVFNILVSDPVDLHASAVPDLKFITSSSAPLSLETLTKFEEIYGIPINEMAGMTEAGWMMGNPPGKRKPGSVGTPFKYKQVSVRGPGGRDRAAGEEGEIVVHGASVGRGYLTEDGDVRPFPADGFATGDIGYKDTDGYVFITGRKKDLIIRGGVNISPSEIVNRLLQHPMVREAAVVGVPDRTYGEEVICFIVPEPGQGLRPEDCILFCNETLPAFKVPKRVYFLEEIPKNPRGKVSKSLLLQTIGNLDG